MNRSVVAGAGTMGVGIAAVLLAAGDDVVLVEVSAERAAAAAERVIQLRDRIRARAGEASGPTATLSGDLMLVESPRLVEPGPDLIIEAVPEQPELKRRLLTKLETLEPSLMGSNTSSLSIASLAAPLKDRGRFLGLHFFNPVPSMALVEIVRGPETNQTACEDALALVERIGKQSIVVNDAPGFATSRLGLALGLEAIRMVEQGVAEPEAIDRAMTLGYGHPMGPLRLTDLVGLDVRLDIARNLEAAYGERFTPPDLLVQMVRSGRLGKKSGTGFYDWSEK